MTTNQQFQLPDIHEWSLAAVRLLQGVVYHDDGPAWDLLLCVLLREELRRFEETGAE